MPGTMEERVDVEEVPLLNEALSKSDCWTSIEDRRERRRAQNRLSQRAVRRRKNPQRTTPLRSRLEDIRQGHQIGELRTAQHMRSTQHASGPPSAARHSSPGHWVRTQEVRTVASPNAISLNSDASHCEFDFRALRNLDGDVIAQSRCTFPLSLDHLLPLIYTNIYRAVLTNLLLLHMSPQFLCTSTKKPANTIFAQPLRNALPPSLLPTQLQMSVPHPEWMNILPMPSARDALIKRWLKDDIDQCGFCFDLLGEEEKGGYGRTDIDDCKGRDRETQDFRQGLIIWGDPWVEGNWEVTDGFVRKWGWVMKECKADVLRSTNYWRGIRGEEPLGWVEDVEA